jgi:hypothetical protein
VIVVLPTPESSSVLSSCGIIVIPKGPKGPLLAAFRVFDLTAFRHSAQLASGMGIPP